MRTFSLEGWGLTTNAHKQLIVSDGSSHIQFFRCPIITHGDGKPWELRDSTLVMVS